MRQADGREFFMGAGGLAQRGELGTSNQNQAGAQWIGQRLDGLFVLCALFLEPGQRAQA